MFGPPGYEINLLYIAGLIALVLGDPGPLSVDRWLARRRESSQRPAVRGNDPLKVNSG
jgi:hypothetical protein